MSDSPDNTDNRTTNRTAPSAEARALAAQLTTEEKVALLSGSDVWRTAAVERLGIPAVKVSDGPNGVRGDSTTGAKAVCLPASICVAASFDADLVVELGRLLGRETIRKGAHILLAPTINMARHPLGGRNFESFGEDPLLTAELAVAYIQGVQDEGAGACAKHFVANDVEDNRLTVSSELDAKTLREVYLLPFEAAVEAGVWSVMAAYPKLNGEHCTENHWLLTTLLREEWGFDGLVMSDWGATHHPTRSVAAGLDLEMPGPASALGPKLVAAVEAGEIAVDVVEERAATMIDLTLRAGLLGKTEEPERSVDLPEERELVRRAAVEGMVLLRNQSNPQSAPQPILPFDDDLGSVAVIGANADPGIIQGGGSAQLTPHYSVSPLEGLAAALPKADVVHRQGCVADRYLPQPDPSVWVQPDAGDSDSDGVGPLKLEIFDNPDLAGEPAVTRTANRFYAFYQGGNTRVPDAELWSQRWTGRLRVTETGSHRFGVFGVGRCRVLVDGKLIVDNWTDPQLGQAFFGYSSDEEVGEAHLEAGAEAEVVVEWSSTDNSPLVGLQCGIRFPLDEDQLMDDAVAAAEAADAAVVIVGLTAEWETESHDRVMFGLPGRQDELVTRVAAANPRTVVVVNAGGPVDLPWLEDVPATLMVWYPGQEYGAALADVLLGRSDPGGRLPVTFPRSMADTPTAKSVPGDGRLLNYSEETFVGYRWYTDQNIDPLVPFGHGLSYTRFELTEPSVLVSNGRTAVSVSVRNIGDRQGKSVVQAYLDPAQSDRPRVLAGFVSTRLEPGEQADVVVPISAKVLRGWNPDEDRWEPLVGPHRIDIGTSSADIAHQVELP